ncbi:type VI toxin-antitoxin system SocB family DNA replication inhibitor toxin [Pseudochelatococcus sp. B33]
MTTRLLPDIDLARIAPQRDDMKRKSLEQMKGGFSTFSYKPFRSCISDILNVQPELDLGAAEPTPWAVIEAELRKRSKSDEEFTYNQRVALGLHDFATSGRVIGRRHEFFPLSMGMGKKVTFWLPMILAIDEQASALFIEPRRTRGLTAEGRRFAFSMMHERIRAADEDFAEVRLTIAQFGDPSEDCRAVRLHTDERIDLYSREDLEQMVASTYDMWREVLEERERKGRGRATGTGPLI